MACWRSACNSACICWNVSRSACCVSYETSLTLIILDLSGGVIIKQLDVWDITSQILLLAYQHLHISRQMDES